MSRGAPAAFTADTGRLRWPHLSLLIFVHKNVEHLFLHAVLAPDFGGKCIRRRIYGQMMP